MREQQRGVPALAEADARPRGRPAARVRPAALPAPRGGFATPVRAGRARAARSACEGSEPVELEGGLRVRGRSTASTTCDGMALVIDYKTGSRSTATRSPAGSPRTASRRRSTCSRCAKLLGLRAGRRRVRGARRATTRARAGWCRGGGRSSASAGSRATGSGRRSSQEKLDWARERVRETDRLMRSGDLLLAARTAAPGTAAARTRRSAGGRGEGSSRPSSGGRSSAATGRCSCAPARAAARRGAGRALRAGRARRRRRGRADPRDHVHREGGRRAEEPAAAPLPRARPARGRARGRGRVGLDDPRLLLAAPARQRARAGIDPEYRVLDEARRGAAAARRVRPGARGVLGAGATPRAHRPGRRVHARPAARHGTTAYSHLRSRGERRRRSRALAAAAGRGGGAPRGGRRATRARRSSARREAAG